MSSKCATGTLSASAFTSPQHTGGRATSATRRALPVLPAGQGSGNLLLALDEQGIVWYLATGCANGGLIHGLNEWSESTFRGCGGGFCRAGRSGRTRNGTSRGGGGGGKTAPRGAALKTTYPEARVYEVGHRVRSVYGSPMTRGNTPREAAEGWLKAYGEAFADGPMQLVDFRDVPRRARNGGGAGGGPGGGRVFMYKQTMDGLDVVGSSARVMVDEWRGQSRVLYASARVGVRPEGGLPKPTITAQQAIEAARKHATGQRMTAWSEPELVAIYDEAPRFGRRAGEAYPAWKCIGGGGAGGPGGGGVTLESYSFYVDAIHGTVTRTHDNIMRFADITGRVTGMATPTDTNANPEILGPDTWTGTASCPNAPVPHDLGDVFVQAFDFESGVLIDSTYTASDGTYTLNVPNGVTVTLEANLVSQQWVVFKDTFVNGWPDIWGTSLDPIPPILGQSVTAPASPSPATNFQFNAIPDERHTARVNAHAQMIETWNYLDPSHEIDTIPIVVNTGLASAAYIVPGSVSPPPPLHPGWPNSEPAPWPGRLAFRSGGNGGILNPAYSTAISHEYAHFLLFIDLNVDVVFAAFHEGFADVLAHFVHDTEVVGQDFFGCDLHLREPLISNRQYPDCDTDSHVRGEVLSGVWVRILRGMRVVYGQSMGWDKTRELHLNWIPLAQPAGEAACSTPSGDIGLDQSADDGTLIEVLTADDDDGNLANGTPHCEIIRAAFTAQGIGSDSCTESANSGPGGCYADFDDSTGVGVLDVFDFLAFQTSFVEGQLSACNCDSTAGSGVCDIFDFICFQTAFAAGCEKE
jgi:hypothetical protein